MLFTATFYNDMVAWMDTSNWFDERFGIAAAGIALAFMTGHVVQLMVSPIAQVGESFHPCQAGASVAIAQEENHRGTETQGRRQRDSTTAAPDEHHERQRSNRGKFHIAITLRFLLPWCSSCRRGSISPKCPAGYTSAHWCIATHPDVLPAFLRALRGYLSSSHRAGRSIARTNEP